MGASRKNKVKFANCTTGNKGHNGSVNLPTHWELSSCPLESCSTL